MTSTTLLARIYPICNLIQSETLKHVNRIDINEEAYKILEPILENQEKLTDKDKDFFNILLVGEIKDMKVWLYKNKFDFPSVTFWTEDGKRRLFCMFS